MEENEVVFSLDIGHLKSVPEPARREAIQRLIESLPQDVQDMMQEIIKNQIAKGCAFCGKRAASDTISKDENGNLETDWFPVRNQKTGEHRMCCADCRLWLGPKRQ